MWRLIDETHKNNKLTYNQKPLDHVLIKGWVRTRRDSKGFSFIEVNDGSCLKNIQIIADNSLNNYKDIIKTLNRICGYFAANL